MQKACILLLATAIVACAPTLAQAQQLIASYVARLRADA
jgi:hypothetical protein